MCPFTFEAGDISKDQYLLSDENGVSLKIVRLKRTNYLSIFIGK